MKKCLGCGIEKPATVDFFEAQKLGKFGVTSRCRDCKKIERAKLRDRPDQKARQQAWRDANKEKVRAANKAYRDAGYVSTEAVSKWRERNLEKARAYSREQRRRRYATEAWYNLKAKITARVHAMVSDKAGRKSEHLLGYTSRELIDHIESRFTDGMSWEGVFSGEIHIDHIIPVSYFKCTSVDDADFKKCWALSNLQPLWATDNLMKCSKLPHNFTSAQI